MDLLATLAGSGSILLATLPTAVAQQVPAKNELWRTSYTAGNLPSATALVGDRYLVFPQSPVSIHISNVTTGQILSDQVLPQVGQFFYKVTQATPIPESAVLLLTIDDGCTNDSNVCSGRLWRYNTTTGQTVWEQSFANIRPVQVGAVSTTTVVQAFDDSTLRAFDALLGNLTWVETTTIIVRGGGTAIGTDRCVFSGLGGRLVVLDTDTGALVDSYVAPNPCVLDEAPYSEDYPPVTKLTQTCSNFFQRPRVTEEFIYIVDDLVGLSQFAVDDVAAGPIWTTAFATDSSQQSTTTPFVDGENGIVYATAGMQVGAILLLFSFSIVL